MARILKTHLVQYQCECKAFHPLDELYLCRSCFDIKCNDCAYQQVEVCFCRACLENITVGDARQNKNTCPTCHQCPVCGMVMQVRSVNDKYRLHCGNCKYTSADGGYEDRENTNSEWPLPEDLNADHFKEIISQLQKLATFDKNEFEKKNVRRKSNVYISDRFGLSGIVYRKKMELQRPPSLDNAIRDDDPKELSLEEIMKPIADPNTIPTMEQQLRCLQAEYHRLYPRRLPLSCRRLLRCNASENNLVRCEYNPASINFRVKSMAIDVLPDIRIYRLPPLIAQVESTLLLFISNYSNVPMAVNVNPVTVEDDTSIVSCLSKPLKIEISNADDIADIDKSLQEEVRKPSGSTSDIVFTKRNRTAVALQIVPPSVRRDNYLILDIVYSPLGNPFRPMQEKPSLRHQNQENTNLRPLHFRVKLSLGGSGC